MKTIILTGAAGFIGANTAGKLLKKNVQVIGVDNLNDYYDIRLKTYRLEQLKKFKNFKFYKLDIENISGLRTIFKKYKPEAVINLAARAGVRYSMENPFVYMSTNAVGTLNLLEICKEYETKKFVLASTSSLYAGQKMPFKETLAVNTPISPYAASKKAAEAMCYTYNYLYGLDITILRYFTVYGPAGRPDMSIFRFIKWIDEGKPLELFGDGNQSRDFTYVDDIARGTINALKMVNFKVINLGGNDPYKLNYVIKLIEKYLHKKANIKSLPFHKADIMATWADVGEARKVLNWQSKIKLEEGIKRTVNWYTENKGWLKNIKI
ncbi:MAG: GDP-mannose 4,6-dehydratase [bacterium]|nr:GDP-mannose 4,6-dehydratase [bacterium]